MTAQGTAGRSRFKRTRTFLSQAHSAESTRSPQAMGREETSTSEQPKSASTTEPRSLPAAKEQGDAGDIDIAATGSFISRNSKVSTSSENADGGNIKITAPYMVHLKESEITASVGGGASTVGGNISIDPQFVILDHSKIIANAYEGQGGNIQIVSNVFLADPFSVVDASSALGIDGTVDIRAPITELSGTLVPLGEDFISAFELLREPCMARIRGGKYSSFIVSGRDGLPIEPGRLLPSPMP